MATCHHAVFVFVRLVLVRVILTGLRHVAMIHRHRGSIVMRRSYRADCAGCRAGSRANSRKRRRGDQRQYQGCCNDANKFHVVVTLAPVINWCKRAARHSLLGDPWRVILEIHATKPNIHSMKPFRV